MDALKWFWKKTVKFGSNLNELMRGNMRDTEADQRAIFSGFNFKGYTKWKKIPLYSNIMFCYKYFDL